MHLFGKIAAAFFYLIFNSWFALLMGYRKEDEKKLKGYFFSFFKGNEKVLNSKLTNLVLFRSETWAVSDNFYNSYICGIENCYVKVAQYLSQCSNERKTFNLNFFSKDFRKKFINWEKDFSSNKLDYGT